MALRAVTSNGVAITPSSLTVSGTLTGSSGTATAASISPTINQSGTAGYTALDINPTESATGSGTKLLQRWAVGVSALAQINNSGTLSAQNLIAVGAMGLGTALGSADVTLNRDAADTLALRRSTNAQTFRIAQTYTDSSNRRYLQLYFSGSQAIILNTGNGTAAGAGGLLLSSDSGGNLDFGVAGSAYWRVNGSGAHFLPVTSDSLDVGSTGARIRSAYARQLLIADGITAPSATANYGTIYIDSADGDLKIIFGDGTIKTIVTDT